MPTKIMKFQSPIPETPVRVSEPTGSMSYPTQNVMFMGRILSELYKVFFT